MKLIDTHCHLDVAAFDPDRKEVFSQAQRNGVEKIIVPAIKQTTWTNLLAICNEAHGLYPALGMHPVYLSDHKDSDLNRLEEKLNVDYVVAVGEIGLDYYVKDLDRQQQLDLLDAQLAMANNLDLPVILHCRKAYDDLIKLLQVNEIKGGISHAFNGSIQHAHKLIDLGLKLGFGGMLTYPRSTKLRQLAKQLPLSSIVLETDSPDLTVIQHQGERNSPAYLPFVLEALSQIRDESQHDLAQAIWSNSVEVFGLE